MLSPNTILRERYRIIHQLGQGGMGAVYQAMDENLSCVVAVKETFAATDEQRRAFRREAELLANLSHAALPRVTDHFTHGEGQFLVMQFVPGHDLAELLELREQPFSVAKVLGWADQLLDALEELHSSDPPIIHRDIKPANLKVTPKGKVLLLDFGLAKGFAGQMSTAEADSHGKSVYGYTPHYAPLEQIRGAGTDPRSDLYSLAATLWTLLTGKVPPDALSRVAEKEDGNADPLRSAHEINPEVPVPLSNLLKRAMALNRNQRPGTASELRNALRDAGEAEFERATLPLQRPSAPEQTSLPPSLPPPEPTIKAPEPTSLSPDPPASKPAMKAPESVSKNSAPDPQSVPTMRVDSPPAVPSWERGGVSATAVSFAGEDDKQRKQRKRIALIVAGVFVVAISIAVVAWIVWPSTTNLSLSNSSGPTQTNKQAGDTATTASSSAKPRAGTIVRNQIGMELVYVPPGSFMMGSNNGGADEKPVHEVTIREGFYMGRYEVTQVEWQQVMGNSPSKFKGDNLPVEQVSWNDAQSFINKLNESNDGLRYRLPTEAEWEYACRAGTTGDYAGDLDSMAWYSANSGSKTHPVGAKQPNGFGLYDMHGNVWEWCQDWYHPSYDGAPSDGSAWLSGGEQKYRVLRGGSWDYFASFLRSALRSRNTPDIRYDTFGFRVVAVR